MYRIECMLIFYILKLDLGNSEFKFRSVGGRIVMKGEFPFIMLLVERKPNGTYCSATALTSTWGITAEHCFEPFPSIEHNTTYFVLYSGSDNYLKKSDIISYVFHPATDHKHHFRHDIALFKTKQNMDVIKFGKLSALDYLSIVGYKAFAVGFGVTNITELEIPILQVAEGMLSLCGELNEPALTNSICLMPLCNVRGGGASNTPGDSGGPVVHKSGIVGLISSGPLILDEKRKHLPKIYGAPLCFFNVISPYLNWISDITKSNVSE